MEPDLRKHHVPVVPGIYPETLTGLGVQVGNLAFAPGVYPIGPVGGLYVLY